MSWDTTAGGIDDFDLEVRRAYFGTDGNYNGGQSTLLFFEGPTSMEDPERKASFVVSFSVGKGWVTDDGKTLRHESGRPDVKFNRSSAYGRIMDRARDEFGIGGLLASRGDSTEAKVWEGLKFHFKRERLEYGAGLEARERLMPVEYLGEVGSSNGSTAATQTAAAPATSSLLPEIKSLAVKVALGGGTYQDFFAQVKQVPGIANDDIALQSVLDEQNGVWAEATR